MTECSNGNAPCQPQVKFYVRLCKENAVLKAYIPQNVRKVGNFGKGDWVEVVMVKLKVGEDEG